MSINPTVPYCRPLAGLLELKGCGGATVRDGTR